MEGLFLKRLNNNTIFLKEVMFTSTIFQLK